MPSTSTDVIDGISTSVAVKAPCALATTANITLSGEQTIDGTLTSETRVFVKNQTTASQNGIYKSRTSAWTREPDFDGNRDVVEGTLIPVNRGATNADTLWRVTNTGAITIDTTSLTFERAAVNDSNSVAFTQTGTGAVATTVQAALRQVAATPDMFGADGVDDAVAINLAIQAHGYVRIPADREYILNTAIVPKTGMYLDCRGANIKLKNGSNAHMFRAPDGAVDWTVEGGIWNGNKANQTTGGCGFTSASGGTNIRGRLVNITVHDCYSHGVGWNSLVLKHFIEYGLIAYDNGASGVGSIESQDRSAIGLSIAYDNATSNFGGSGITSRTAYAAIVGEDAGTADNLTSYGNGADFNTVASFVSLGGANNGMHLSGDYNAFAAIAIDSPAQYGLVSRTETGGVVTYGLAMAGVTVKSAGKSSFWLDNNDGFAGAALVSTSPTEHGLYLDTANTNGHLSGAMKLAGIDNVRLQAATDIVVDVMSADAVGDGIQIADSSKNVVGGRFTGNALGINETGTSDINLLAGVSSTVNTSDTSIFANDASQVHASILGGTRNITAASTLDLHDYCDFFVLSGATAVDNIEASYAGRVIQIRSDGATTINDGGNLRLSGNLSLTDLDCVVLVCDGTNWYQVSVISAN